MNKKENFWICPFLIIAVCLMLSAGCEKDDDDTPVNNIPVLTTDALSNITQTTATCGGNITSDGSATVTARGVCWSSNQSPTIADSKTTDGTGTGIFTSNISGLSANTTYYVRAYATNSNGTGYGSSVSFTTLSTTSQVPVLTTNAVTDITQSTATCGGNITSDGGATVTARGVCWSINQSPTIADSKTTEGTGAGTFTSNITGLSSNTTYYVRAYATNSNGTGYGSAMSFITLQGGATISDVDGNNYTIVTISTQVWMAENLRTTKYKNGASIPLITDNTVWEYSSTPGYCWYSNDQANYGNTYGALYNWYTVNTGNLCPSGWHIPTDTEWTTLITFLGGENVAGGKLKEAGFANWQTPNTGATNETGFTARPGGGRGSVFNSICEAGNWWSATMSDADNAWYRVMLAWDSGVTRAPTGKSGGMSVRCVKD